jgi:putative tricarboxylic transport membrane protein
MEENMADRSNVLRPCTAYSPIRDLLRAALVAAPLFGGITVAQAQTMTAPEGPIEIVVGSGPGATPDVIMRRVAKILNEEKLVPNAIVVQNRTGGGWTVASNYVLGKAGNKNILFAMVPSVFSTPIVQGLPNTYEKVTPLAMLARINLLVVVRADSPMKTLADFVAAAKTRTVRMAGANVGSTDHIVAALIEKAGKVKLDYVPFDGGGGQVTSALLGGIVDGITLPPDEAMPLLEGKKVKAIGVLSTERLPYPELKDIPTGKEVGVDVVWGQYYGIAAVPDLDPAIAAWWNDKLTRMVTTPSWAQMMKDTWMTSAFVPADKARAAMNEIYAGFAAVLTELSLAKKK